MATDASKSKIEITHYQSETDITWCPGCGDFGVLRGLLTALASLGKRLEETVIVSGIGCSSNLPHFARPYGFHTIHGRGLPVASGVRLANPDLTVVYTGGDGDGYGIGMGHFIHACRRNLDLTYIVMNNQVYGLTTGQASPTTAKGVRTKSTPGGSPEEPVNPMALALAAGASFVSRAFSGDPRHMAEVIQAALEHRGFALVDVFSPCVTFNKVNTYPWFRQRVYKLGPEHDPSDPGAAWAKAMEWGDKIPLGVLYRAGRPTYEEGEPALARGPPAKQDLRLTDAEWKALLNDLA
ncbi:MAG: 2-oxoacid:ferredoxin oxidoreductase subunit beta [Halobacteria archaeon]